MGFWRGNDEGPESSRPLPLQGRAQPSGDLDCFVYRGAISSDAAGTSGACRALRPPYLILTISRRTFIKAGLVGAVALATAGWLKGPHAPPSGIPRRTLDADAEAILAAMVPVLLDGALPSAPDARQRALAETLTSIDVAIAGLPPAAQAELAQLFALLALPPVRLGLARVAAPWPQAAPATI